MGYGLSGLVFRRQKFLVFRGHGRTVIAVATLVVAALWAASGANAQTMKLSTTTISFGNIYAGAYANKSLTITNTGTKVLNITNISVAGTGFSRSAMNLSATVQVKKSISFQVIFAPSSAGSDSGTVTIRDNASSGTATVALSGTAVAPPISVTPATVSFSQVAVGKVATVNATLKNTSSASVVISRTSISGAGFTLTGITAPVTMAAGGSTAITFQFAPKSAGAVSGAVDFATNDAAGWLQTSTLSGTGVSGTQTGTLSATPTSLAFGNVNVGSSSSKTVSVQNTGSASVMVSNTTLSGNGYAVTGMGSNQSLAAGQSTALTVVFAPTTAASSSGDISVASNASNSPLNIGLSGTGMQAAGHSVTLTWAASTSSVAGYNVYRGAVSGGPYATLLNNGLVTGTTFTDTNVQAGVTYYYVVVAVTSGGVDSSDSNQATATVP